MDRGTGGEEGDRGIGGEEEGDRGGDFVLKGHSQYFREEGWSGGERGEVKDEVEERKKD